MAQDLRQLGVVGAVEVVQVALAQPGVGGHGPHLVRSRVVDVDDLLGEGACWRSTAARTVMA